MAIALSCWDPTWEQWALCRSWLTTLGLTPAPCVVEEVRTFLKGYHRKAKIPEEIARGFTLLVAGFSWREVEYLIAWKRSDFVCRKAARSMGVHPSSCEEALRTARRRLQTNAVKLDTWFEPVPKCD